MSRLAPAVAALGFAVTWSAPGCSRTSELLDDGAIRGLVSIEVSPGDSMVIIDDVTAIQRLDFVAVGRFEDGGSRDVTGEVAWGVDNPAPGGFAAPGKWQSSNRAGGLVSAAARAGDVRAVVEIAVHLRPSINDPSFPVGGDPAGLFDPSTPVVEADPASSPVIAYPPHQVMFPINLYRALFQLEPVGTSDAYRFRFEAEYLDLSVFTTNDRWQAEGATWDYLALTAAGGKAVMTVAGVEAVAPTTIFQSAPIDIHFSVVPVDGAIYYWSTSAEGIMKGVLSDPAPTRFYTQPPDTTCVACHTISRDGTRLAAGYDGETLQAITVPDREVVVSAERDYKMGWSTFSPDSKRLLLADKGSLRLLDAETGDPVGTPDGAVDLGGAKVTHPDWSPRGDHVVVAVCFDGANNNKDVGRCSIGRIPVADDAFGAVEIIAPAAGGNDNNYFPKYSPDGEWIAYVNADGKSKDQRGATLRIVPAAGGDFIDLAIASSRVGPLDAVTGTGNTMPTWAPTTGSDVYWLAFSSIRDYGKVLAGDKADQLWIAGVDPRRALAEADPSFAAFWLPLQDLGERNHRAFWALDTDIECASSVEVCDGFDNDCDGSIDEDCIPCAGEEVCIDGADNDCNGRVDDGCIQ